MQQVWPSTPLLRLRKERVTECPCRPGSSTFYIDISHHVMFRKARRVFPSFRIFPQERARLGGQLGAKHQWNCTQHRRRDETRRRTGGQDQTPRCWALRALQFQSFLPGAALPILCSRFVARAGQAARGPSFAAARRAEGQTSLCRAWSGTCGRRGGPMTGSLRVSNGNLVIPYWT